MKAVVPCDAGRVFAGHLSAEQFMRCCDQVWSTDRRSSVSHERTAPRHGSIVYAKRDHVGGLFRQLRRSRARVVVVTAESDEEVPPNEMIPPQVAVWFSTNSLHPRVHALPLGLGNSYCSVTAKAADLASALGAPKTGLLYVNFRPSTNPLVRQPIWESYDQAEREGWATRQPGNIAGPEYANELSRHVFALCPPGNGIDTHRFWEALYAGTIPLVQRNKALEPFADLPILMVDRIESLDRGFLEDQARSLQQRDDWNWPKLFLPFWRERFEQARGSIGARLPLTQEPACLLRRFFPGRS